MIRREAGRAVLSAVFVDYDNIYLSLKRKNEEAAKRFARDAGTWIKAIESGALITSTNGAFAGEPRRIVMNRCYGNPVPRRNQSDNSTDVNSFPFVRHHFLRAGFEIIEAVVVLDPQVRHPPHRGPTIKADFVGIEHQLFRALAHRLEPRQAGENLAAAVVDDGEHAALAFDLAEPGGRDGGDWRRAGGDVHDPAQRPSA